MQITLLLKTGSAAQGEGPQHQLAHLLLADMVKWEELTKLESPLLAEIAGAVAELARHPFADQREFFMTMMRSARVAITPAHQVLQVPQEETKTAASPQRARRSTKQTAVAPT